MMMGEGEQDSTNSNKLLKNSHSCRFQVWLATNKLRFCGIFEKSRSLAAFGMTPKKTLSAASKGF
jgi:hypothetical protein